MSLIEVLRSARAQPITVIHEFKLFYDPGRLQVHAFVEGQADKAFYSHFVTPRLSVDTRLHVYDCRGKAAVLETMQRLTSDYPHAQKLLFFVDKDLDDYLGQSVAFSRLFCTNVYSIENYLIDSKAVLRWFEENWHLRGVSFNLGPVQREFARSLRKFTRLSLPIMAWVLAHRRLGHRPNLSCVDFGRFVNCNLDGSVSRLLPKTNRLTYLDGVSQVETTREVVREIRRCMTILSTTEAMIWLRGKFALWFLQQFMKVVEKNIREAAREAGGSASCRTQIHEANLVECMVSKIKEPASVAAFLDIWLPYIRAPVPQ